MTIHFNDQSPPSFRSRKKLTCNGDMYTYIILKTIRALYSSFILKGLEEATGFSARPD